MLPIILLAFAAAPPLPEPLPAGALARLGTTRFRHGFTVNAVAFSPDGGVVASAGNGRGLCLWDASSGDLLHHCSAQRFPATDGLAFSPDGKQVVIAAGIAFSPVIWDVRSGKEVRRLEGHANSVRAGAWSPDGRWVASGSYDMTVRLWDAKTGKSVRVLKGHRATPWAIAFRPDSRCVASADTEGHLIVTDVGSGDVRWRGRTRDGHVALAFCGRWLALAGADGKVQFLDADTGKPGKTVSVGGAVRAVAASGGRVAVAGADGYISVVEGGKVSRRWRAASLALTTVAFAPDGHTLASGGVWRSSIDFWDVRTGKPVRRKAGHAALVDHIQASGGEAISIGRDGSLARWRLDGAASAVLQLPGLPGVLSRFAISPRGDVVVASPIRTGEIDVYDARTAAPLRRLAGHGKRVWGLRISPDGRLLASLGGDHAVRVWSLRTGRQLLRLSEGLDGIGSRGAWPGLEFSPDGKLLLVLRPGKEAILFDVGSGKRLRKFDVNYELGGACFSPDGKLVALSGGFSDNTVVLWETDTGEVRRAWRTGQTGVYGVAFSPDGRLLATAGDDGDGGTLLWELATGKRVAVLDGQQGAVLGLTFTQDGRSLLTGGSDSTVLVWDVTGRATRKGPSASAESLWERLGEDDERAVAAVWELAEAKDAVKVLQRRLKPLAGPPVRELEKALAGLQSDDFETRRKAAEALEKYGPGAIPALRKNLLPKEGVEVYLRVEAVLKKLERSDTTARQRRAVWALELMGTPPARALLKKLAGGVSGAPQTKEAKTALRRMGG